MRLPADPRVRALVVAGAAVVALLVVLWAVDRLAPAPHGPRSSSFATSPAGLAAYASLLERSGLEVRRQLRPVAKRAPEPGETLVVLDPSVVDSDEADAIGRWVRAGGRLVAGGTRDASWLDGILADPPKWRGGGEERSRVLAPGPETARVNVVRSQGSGGWHELGRALPLLGPADRPLAVAASAGRGTVVLLADASPLQNRLLDAADNAAFGVDVAGGRPVVFLETVHGYGADARGFSGLPVQVRWALLGLLLAGLVAVWSAGRRFGPPEDRERALPPARTEYVDALAAALARTASEAELREAREDTEEART